MANRPCDSQDALPPSGGRGPWPQRVRGARSRVRCQNWIHRPLRYPLAQSDGHRGSRRQRAGPPEGMDYRSGDRRACGHRGRRIEVGPRPPPILSVSSSISFTPGDPHDGACSSCTKRWMSLPSKPVSPARLRMATTPHRWRDEDLESSTIRRTRTPASCGCPPTVDFWCRNSLGRCRSVARHRGTGTLTIRRLGGLSARLIASPTEAISLPPSRTGIRKLAVHRSSTQMLSTIICSAQ